MRVQGDPNPANNGLFYLLTDHLGSTSVSYRDSNGKTITQRYYAWGTIRPGPGNALPTDYAFTGQPLDETAGLYYYGARYYDPALGRFLQADTIVPDPTDSQSLNRYAYVLNNPVRYTDPSGHCIPGYDCPGDKGQNEPNAGGEWTPYDPVESARTAIDMGILWFSGHGEFGPQWLGTESSLTQDIMYDPGVQEFLALWADLGYQSGFCWKHTRDERGEGSEWERRLEGTPVFVFEHLIKPTYVLLGGASESASGEWDLVGATIGSLDQICGCVVGDGYALIQVDNTMSSPSDNRMIEAHMGQVRRGTALGGAFGVGATGRGSPSTASST